jgi:hypothetical protein
MRPDVVPGIVIGAKVKGRREVRGPLKIINEATKKRHHFHSKKNLAQFQRN